ADVAVEDPEPDDRDRHPRRDDGYEEDGAEQIYARDPQVHQHGDGQAHRHAERHGYERVIEGVAEGRPPPPVPEHELVVLEPHEGRVPRVQAPPVVERQPEAEAQGDQEEEREVQQRGQHEYVALALVPDAPEAAPEAWPPGSGGGAQLRWPRGAVGTGLAPSRPRYRSLPRQLAVDL